MSDHPIESGRWQASDGKWYPPEQWTGPPGSAPPGSTPDGRASLNQISGPLPVTHTFVPSLRAALPDGWFAKESITLLAPDGQANVIVSSEPLDPTIDCTRYAEVQGELLRREFPGFFEYSFGPRPTFGHNSGYVRRFSWVPPDGVQVHQVQLYFVRPGRGFTATATTPSTNVDRFNSTFELILSSVRIVESES